MSNKSSSSKKSIKVEAENKHLLGIPIPHGIGYYEESIGKVLVTMGTAVPAGRGPLTEFGLSETVEGARGSLGRNTTMCLVPLNKGIVCKAEETVTLLLQHRTISHKEFDALDLGEQQRCRSEPGGLIAYFEADRTDAIGVNLKEPLREGKERTKVLFEKAFIGNAFTVASSKPGSTYNASIVRLEEPKVLDGIPEVIWGLQIHSRLDRLNSIRVAFGADVNLFPSLGADVEVSDDDSQVSSYSQPAKRPRLQKNAGSVSGGPLKDPIPTRSGDMSKRLTEVSVDVQACLEHVGELQLSQGELLSINQESVRMQGEFIKIAAEIAKSNAEIAKSNADMLSLARSFVASKSAGVEPAESEPMPMDLDMSNAFHQIPVGVSEIPNEVLAAADEGAVGDKA